MTSLFLDACRGPGNAPPSPVDHAPGGALPARVPGGAQQGLVPRAVQEPGAGRRGDAAADPALRLRRRHPVFGSAGPAGGDGPAGGLHRRGPDHPDARAGRGRPRPDRSRSIRRRRRPSCSRPSRRCARPAGRDAPHRVRRRAVHRGHLRDRGQDLEAVHRDQEALLPRAGRRPPAAGADRRGDRAIPAGPGRGRRPGHPDLRFLAGGGVGRGLGGAGGRARPPRWWRRCAPAACR